VLCPVLSVAGSSVSIDVNTAIRADRKTRKKKRKQLESSRLNDNSSLDNDEIGAENVLGKGKGKGGGEDEGAKGEGGGEGSISRKRQRNDGGGEIDTSRRQANSSEENLRNQHIDSATVQTEEGKSKEKEKAIKQSTLSSLPSHRLTPITQALRSRLLKAQHTGTARAQHTASRQSDLLMYLQHTVLPLVNSHLSTSTCSSLVGHAVT
jgi:hypothetical protein